MEKNILATFMINKSKYKKIKKIAVKKEHSFSSLIRSLIDVEINDQLNDSKKQQKK
jgi:hypothetical protein